MFITIVKRTIPCARKTVTSLTRTRWWTQRNRSSLYKTPHNSRKKTIYSGANYECLLVNDEHCMHCLCSERMKKCKPNKAFLTDTAHRRKTGVRRPDLGGNLGYRPAKPKLCCLRQKKDNEPSPRDPGWSLGRHWGLTDEAVLRRKCHDVLSVLSQAVSSPPWAWCAQCAVQGC